MPTSEYSQGWQVTLRSSRFVFYALAGGMGLSGLIFTPTTISGTIGEPMTYLWSALAIFGSAAGMIGVAWNRYRLEWIAAWPLAGGALSYAATVWIIVAVTDSPTRMAQAFGLTALGFAMICHGFTLAAFADKLRRQHATLTGPVPVVRE